MILHTTYSKIINLNYKKDLNKIKGYLNSSNILSKILTNNGYYTNINNKLEHYYLKKNLKEPELLIINNNELVLHENNWEKNLEELIYIPLPYKIIDLTVNKYKIPNTTIEFIVEIFNDKIIDNYFILNDNQHFEKILMKIYLRLF